MKTLAVVLAGSALLLAPLLVPLAARAAEDPKEKRIEAKIVSVTKNAAGCFEDLGYVVADDVKAREADAREQHPDGNDFFNKDNFGKKGTYLGAHVVVVQSKKPIPRESGCDGVGIGLGFGSNEAAAKKDAVANLYVRWPNFDEKKHGLVVALSEKREGTGQ